MEKLIQLAEDVEGLMNETEITDNEVLSLEKDYLRKIIDIAKKGIKYEKVFQKEIGYNNMIDSNEIDYFVDQEGKVMKGIEVDSISLTYKSDVYGGSQTDIQLYLLQDGSMKIFNYSSEWSNYQNDICKDYRTISESQDLSEFSLDNIVREIERHLEDRLEKLGDRKKAQLDRLEKLRKVML